MNETNRELLELAAKAAGWCPSIVGITNETCRWNPLEDDGDALRLAIMLRINLKLDDIAAAKAGFTEIQSAPTLDGKGPWYWKEWNKDDSRVATRIAIVRAAAEIGRNK